VSDTGRIVVRDAETDEIDQIARVWFDAWRDAHEGLVPAELTRARTLESLRDRIAAAIDHVRVVGAPGNPVGFALVKEDELYQLFVAAAARGTGAAAALIADAEEQIADVGFRTAWLACAIGNERAARFYAKHGWRRVGNMTSRLQTINGEMTLEVWRYEKDLPPLA
jgi:GNAT superfamily N-acetyltransferase